MMVSQAHLTEIMRGDVKRTMSKFAAVAIGRNEGERLKRCLESLSTAVAVVYVDSGSTDGSVQLARELSAKVIELDMSVPFTAARARNAGFRHLRKTVPDLVYVQFVDGDCELNPRWPQQAICYLDSHEEVGAVCGRRRERFPERSIYNWLCDREWDGPIGEVLSCGGDVMMRASALEGVGGYRDDLIGGEEPELCVRLRAAGWRVWRLETEMTDHDAAITSFAQWWCRAMRSGYAFANGAYLHGAPPERHFVWESCRAWIWGLWLPAVCLTASVIFWPQGLLAWLIFPLQFLRQTARNRGPLEQRAKLALFQLLMRFPEIVGQLKFLHDRILNRQRRPIEYK
jgi:glycosyltransferase involved in cell wall biosynthesis